ncbi:MAG: non-homologous end-joining DNA ligase [Acidimicrobiales bacterium]
MADSASVDIDGRVVRLTNLTKVLYPEVGFTKGDVIGYYNAVAAVMLPHIAGRALTFKRFPTASTVRRSSRRTDRRTLLIGSVRWTRRGVRSCVFDHRAALVWAGNQAALEIHAPMAKATALDTPTILVFDLDPGAPAGIAECAQVALWMREVLDSVGLAGWAKTSGSKGLQVYVPLNNPDSTHEHASSFALAVGQLLERQHPGKVLVEMTKAKRHGKVFVDWSQNNRAKTTIGVYSLRARSHPTVSTPVSWDEVAAASDGAALSFGADEVVARIEQMGDLFAEVATRVQHLPGPAA